jgi:hypothetical protein
MHGVCSVMRKWLNWESPKSWESGSVSNGLSHTTYGTQASWCGQYDFAKEFQLFYKPEAAEQVENGRPGEVLLIGMGAWYNLDVPADSERFGEDAAEVMRAIRDGHPSMKKGKKWPKDWLRVQLAAMGPDVCADYNKSATPPRVCGAGGIGGCNRPNRFALDVLALGNFLAQHRAGMPRYIFWMDARPQHFPPAGPYQGVAKIRGKTCTPANMSLPRLTHTWRNAVAEAVLSEVAPFVRRIDSDDILLSRSMDKVSTWAPVGASTPTVPDCTHFCLGSAGWHENMVNAMTAVVAVVAEQDPAVAAQAASLFKTTDGRGPRHGMATAACVLAIATIDRSISTGIVVVTAAVSPVVVPAMFVLFWLARMCCKRCDSIRECLFCGKRDSGDSVKIHPVQ